MMYDVIIIGAGPAGLSAAIYAARAKFKVLVIEQENIGGQITITSEIVNYPGVEKSNGSKLTQAMKRQAEAFGAEFIMDEVTDVKLAEDIKVLKTKRNEYQTLGVVIATGAQPRKLGFPGEREFQGHGVAYCATCDGEFFTGKQVFVVGGGFAAVEEGIFLTKYAKRITMIVREEDFTCAKTVAEQIEKFPKIAVKFQTEVEEVRGQSILNYARFRDNQSGETWEYQDEDGFGMFIFAGYVPRSELFEGKLELDKQNYIVTDINRKTSQDGVYAAGDICVKNLRQVVTAVSDGATAATALEKHVSELHEKLNIPEFERKEADLGRLSEHADDANAVEASSNSIGEEGFITEEMQTKLKPVFAKFEHTVTIQANLDESDLSKELEAFVNEFDGLDDKIKVEIVRTGSLQDSESENRLPKLAILRENGTEAGLYFYGIPGGHEFNSFIVGMYNVAGPGQELSEDLKQRITEIDKDVQIKVMVSLSCTMCPEVVMAAQRIASINDRIRAEVYDLKHFPNMKEKYNIMSVPCMVINDEKVVFGKKNLEAILKIIYEE